MKILKNITLLIALLVTSIGISQVKFEAKVSKTKLGINERLRIDFEMNKGGAYRNAFCSEYLNHVVNSEESPNIFSVFEKHEIIVSSR